MRNRFQILIARMGWVLASKKRLSEAMKRTTMMLNIPNSHKLP